MLALPGMRVWFALFLVTLLQSEVNQQGNVALVIVRHLLGQGIIIFIRLNAYWWASGFCSNRLRRT